MKKIIFLIAILLLIIAILLLTINNLNQFVDLKDNIIFSRWWR